MHQLCYKSQYQKAELENSFKRLIPYPCQLFKWQRKHFRDIKAIKLIAAHRLKMHDICGNKCDRIDKYIKKTLMNHLITILKERKQQHQLPLSL